MEGHIKTECSYSVQLETRKCVWWHHRAPMGFIPLCTCSYMAYLLLQAPQGADCSGRQTESWDPWCTFSLCSLYFQPPTLYPHPVPPPSPGQKNYFSSTSSWGQAAAPMWMLHVIGSPTLPYKKHTAHELCVGDAEILFDLYNKRYIAFLPKEGSVCF